MSFSIGNVGKSHWAIWQNCCAGGGYLVFLLKRLVIFSGNVLVLLHIVRCHIVASHWLISLTLCIITSNWMDVS